MSFDARAIARGERAVWVNDGELVVADFREGDVGIEAHPLDHWGCASLDLREDAAFCARQAAGILQVPLGR